MKNRSTMRFVTVFARLLAIVIMLLSGIFAERVVTQEKPEPQISNEGKECIACHSETTPGVVDQWKNSAHYA